MQKFTQEIHTQKSRKHITQEMHAKKNHTEIHAQNPRPKSTQEIHARNPRKEFTQQTHARNSRKKFTQEIHAEVQAYMQAEILTSIHTRTPPHSSPVLNLARTPNSVTTWVHPGF
jgi:hypothetical protein